MAAGRPKERSNSVWLLSTSVRQPSGSRRQTCPSYTEYAKSLEPKLGIPYTTITPLIFILIQTCVHYAMFEDEYYLQSQLEALKQTIRLLMTQYRTEDARPDVKAES